jgi:hypothetical protein
MKDMPSQRIFMRGSKIEIEIDNLQTKTRTVGENW